MANLMTMYQDPKRLLEEETIIWKAGGPKTPRILAEEALLNFPESSQKRHQVEKFIEVVDAFITQGRLAERERLRKIFGFTGDGSCGPLDD